MRRSLLSILALAALAACTQKNTADQQDQAAAAAAADVALGVNRFLLFPNPIGTDPFAQDGGAFETNTTAYAQAYYAAIDPANAKDTIDKWRTVNGFQGYANPARPGTEHLVVFRDVRDLGYGRRMTARRNNDDSSIAFYVENYNVSPNGSPDYSSELNVDAAIRRDAQWHVGTNAIEWTATPCLNVANGYPYNYDPPDCDGTVKFAKYYNFSSADGTRQLTVDLDGHGKKAMPGVCISCHGGRGDPLTPPDQSGSPRYPLVENLPSRKRGDVGAHLHGQNVDSFTYSTTQTGFAKSDMQVFLTDFNQWILCTYPSATPATVTAAPGGTAWGSCNRPTAGANEWQGTAGEMIQSWYGGTSGTTMTQPFSDTYLPAGWNINTTISGTTFTPIDLYKNVVALYCRTCHILRGTNNQNDLDFMTFAKFQSYADRIKVHVFDRGNMPLAKIPHNDFWTSPTAPQMLATFIDSQLGAGTATSSSGSPLMPGRPVADPGPDRMVRTNANAVLTGENSLFAGTFLWTNVSGPSQPSIDNPTGMVAIFNASVAGTYVVNLSVNGGASSKSVTITVDDNFPDPLNIKFAQVKNILQNIPHTLNKHCVDCHVPITTPGQQVGTPLIPPIWYTSTFDRNNDGVVDATDEAWFLKALSGRVNLTEIEASPVLRKPTGNHHGGNLVIDVTDRSSEGGLRNYSVIYNWVLAGMQPGGVAANPLATTPQTLTFGGSPLFSAPISVDGSTSINAANYSWSVISPPGSGAVFANPAAAATTLSVPTTGTYVVQLQVDDGVNSDAFQRTVVVNEAAINAGFNPQTGNTFVTFPPSVNSGSITLTSISTYGATTPATCRWQVVSVPTGAAGTTLDGQTNLDVTKPCSSPATLKVPLAAAGGTYGVQLTASTIGSSTTPVHLITVSNNAPTADLTNTVASQPKTFGQITTTSVPTHGTNSGGAPASTATIAVVGATVSLNGSASTTPVGSLTYSWCLTSQPSNQTDLANYPASVAVCPATTSSGASSTLNMTVRATGSYGVQLTVDNGSATSTTSKTVTVSPAQNVAFPTVAGIVGGSPCSSCHQFGTPLTNVFNPASNTSNSSAIPPWDNAPTLGTVAGSPTENVILYQRLMMRVNLGTPSSSLLVACPSGGCDGGIMPSYGGGFPAFAVGGASYNNLLKWIQDGAPPGN